MKKLAIFISGGSTKIAFLASVVYTFLRRCARLPVKPVEYVGTSSGLILSLFFASEKQSVILKYMPIYTLKMIFGVNPDSFLGKATMVKNFIFKKKLALLEYKGLKRILEKEFTQKDLEEYQDSDMANCWAGVVDIETMEEIYYNLKDKKTFKNVEDVHKIVLASASIPFAAPYQEVFGRKLFDGGLRAHNGASWGLNKLDGFDYALSVYSRTNNWDDYVSSFKKKWGWLLQRVLTALTIDMSFEDSLKAKATAEHKGVKMLEIFAPEKLQEATFEASKEGNLDMIRKGEEEVLKIGVRGFFDIQ